MTTPLGGTDEEEEGVWRWVCGPEKGRVFYRVDKELDAFHAWGVSPNQPDNNAGRGPAENHLTMDIRTGNKYGRWNDISQVVPYRMLVEFSPDEKLPPEARPVELVDTSNHPTQIDAACVSNNGKYRVAGFSAATKQWYVWESPAIPKLGRNEYVRFTHSSSKVALSSGWLLDIETQQWKRFQQGRRLNYFMGDKLGFIRLKRTSVGEWRILIV